LGEVVEERAQRAHFEIDRGGGDQTLVALALLLPAPDLVVVDVGPGDRLDVLAMAEQPLEMPQYLPIATHGLRLVRGMRRDMGQKRFLGLLDRCGYRRRLRVRQPFGR